ALCTGVAEVSDGVSDSSFCGCFEVGAACAGFLGDGSGEDCSKGCFRGEGAGVGVGFGAGLGLGTISICWRLFKKRSRSRFSSLVCCETPGVEISQMVVRTSAIFNFWRRGPESRNSNTSKLCSFKFSLRVDKKPTTLQRSPQLGSPPPKSLEGVESIV